ncbi:hypothetical protein PaeBR_18600 [Paenibacillus sp. BR2-3]|uniref:DUF7667 family protein n=1 Tax=Paenibacillus sp. BR2-3 TaxID=3048494 RepID=UPI0039777482
MLPVHERLAELYTLSCRRQLTLSEAAELQQCLQVNARYCWEMACLNNEAMLALTIDDAAWQQDISNLMYELRLTGKHAKRK